RINRYRLICTKEYRTINLQLRIKHVEKVKIKRGPKKQRRVKKKKLQKCHDPDQGVGAEVSAGDATGGDNRAVYREDAERAVQDMDGRVLSGGRIRVSFARPRTRGRRRRGFDPNLRCYTCGEKGHFSRDCVEIWRQRRRNRSRDRGDNNFTARKRRSYSRSKSRSKSRSPKRSKNRRSRSRSNRRKSRSPRYVYDSSQWI
ncbi:splicing factor, arginine/serine-rich 7, partial [Mytilus galloprovincialis]